MATVGVAGETNKAHLYIKLVFQEWTRRLPPSLYLSLFSLRFSHGTQSTQLGQHSLQFITQGTVHTALCKSLSCVHKSKRKVHSSTAGERVEYPVGGMKRKDDVEVAIVMKL